MSVVEVRLGDIGGYAREQLRHLNLAHVSSMWDYDGDREGRKLIARLVDGSDWVLLFDNRLEADAFREKWIRLGAPVVDDPSVTVNGKRKGRPPGSKNKSKGDKNAVLPAE